MNKNDLKLIAGVLAIAAVFYFVQVFIMHKDGDYVTVTVNGTVYGTYYLDEDREVDINGSNTLQIENGLASMIHADCPDKLCVHQKAISRNKETIVCLPNKVIVEVAGEQEAEYDAVT